MLKLIRTRVALFAAGLVAALCPMLMAPTGGYPSQPTFLAATVNGTAGRTCGANTSSACFLNTTVGHTSWAAYVQPTNTAGNTLGLYINCSGNATDTCFRVDTAAGAPTVKIDGAGGLTGIAPPTVVCTTACSIAPIVVGQTYLVYKTTNTSRASNTVDGADPDLTFNSVPQGQYLVEFGFNFTTGAGGYKFQISATGNNNINTGTQNCGGVGVGVFGNAPTVSNNCATTSAGYGTGQGHIITNAGAGAITFAWSQNSSNAANTTLASPSYLAVTRLL